MAEEPENRVLSYAGGRRRPVRTAQEWHWLEVRVLYRAGLVGLWAAIAFYFGPHWILFRKWTALTAADLVPDLEMDCVPLVRAVLEYQRDHGSLPPDEKALVPAYMAEVPEFGAQYQGEECMYFDHYGDWIKVRFLGGPPEWEARGPFVKGVIPMPPIVLPPATGGVR